MGIEKIFMREIFILNEVPKENVSPLGYQVCSYFWKSLFENLGTKLNSSTTYYPQMYGRTKRVIQVIEDMIHMYVMDKPSD